MAMRTVKDVILQYDGSLTKIPMSSGLFAAYRNAHKCYKEDQAKQKAEATAAATSLSLGKRKAGTEDMLEQLESKKRQLEIKQKEAETIISEGTESAQEQAS